MNEWMHEWMKWNEMKWNEMSWNEKMSGGGMVQAFCVTEHVGHLNYVMSE